LLLLLYQIFSRTRRHRSDKGEQKGDPPTWPGLDSEFYQLEQRLAERGVVRQAGEPLSEWLRRATVDSALAAESNALHGLLRLHYRYRFDPEGLRPGDRQRLREEVGRCLEEVERVVPTKVQV